MPRGIYERKPVEERFWSRIRKGDGCWEWTGPLTEYGYGRLWVNGRMEFTHRVAWEMVNGPITGGLLVCHHCDNPACNRIDHLFLGTQSDNIKDAVKKGRMDTVKRTHCPKGHPYSAENTYRKPAHPTWRGCRTCHRIRESARYHRSKRWSA